MNVGYIENFSNSVTITRLQNTDEMTRNRIKCNEWYQIESEFQKNNHKQAKSSTDSRPLLNRNPDAP